MRESVDKKFKALSKELEWTKLAVKYQSYIDLLIYTLEEEERLANATDLEKRNWALEALRPGAAQGLAFWLNQFHMMMVGDGHLRQEKPLIQMFMEDEWEGRCSATYAEDVKALWLMTQATQIRGHLALIHAQQILVDHPLVNHVDALQLMKEREKIQLEVSGQTSCPAFLVNHTLSLELCEMSDIGFGTIPKDSVIPLECQPGFYPTSHNISCPLEGALEEERPTCEPCNCAEAARDQDCQAVSGQCDCWEDAYGTQCQDFVYTCQHHSTPWKVSDGTTTSLEHHNVECPDAYALTKILLQSLDTADGGQMIRFSFRCCRISSRALPTVEDGTASEWLEYGIHNAGQDLTKHDIGCPKGMPLKQFSRYNEKYKKVRYDFACVDLPFPAYELMGVDAERSAVMEQEPGHFGVVLFNVFKMAGVEVDCNSNVETDDEGMRFLVGLRLVFEDEDLQNDAYFEFRCAPISHDFASYDAFFSLT